MSGLGQYGVGRGALVATTLVLPGPPDPFSRDDWHNLVWDVIDAGVFPEPDDDGGRNFYMIITPPGVNFTDQNVCGTHGYPGDYDFPFDYDRAWAGFVINDGSIDTITTHLSHELVEACTDPEDDGWTIDGLSRPTDEIGDVCLQTVGRVSGVMVQGYWSQSDGACIIPLSAPLLSLQGGYVAAARQPPNPQVDAFAVGTDGALRVIFEVNNGPWNFPIALTGHGFSPPGASVAVQSQPPNDQLDAFIVDSGGTLNVLFEVNNGPWSQPIPLTGQGFAPPGASVAVQWQPPNDQLDAFVVGSDGVLYVLFEVNNGPWSQPIAIG
jgi:hypothetical protein